jgi:hypothetical protein
MLRTIEASLIGQQRSVLGLSDADQFIARLNDLQRKYSSRLLISIIGKKAVKGLSASKLAVLGITDFS